MIKILIFALLCTGCGVKGKPQPPLTPALMGRGQPSYSKATESVKIPKAKKVEGDFEDVPDFEIEKEEQ